MLFTGLSEDASRLTASCAAHGFRVEQVDCTDTALRLLTDAHVAAAVLHVDGELATIDTIRELAPDIPVLAIVKRGAVQDAVAAVQRGATDVMEESADAEQVARVIESVARRSANRRRREPFSSDDAEEPLITTTPRMKRLLDLVGRAAATNANILITGEYGTGKDRVARRLHALSPRSSKPFLTLNACGLSMTMAERLLFGHARGVLDDSDAPGLLERGSGGTVFIDELTHVPTAIQPKLAGMIDRLSTNRLGSSEEIAIDVRFIAATSGDISEALQSGRLVHNLLFRLNAIEIELPPLRERRGDIEALAVHFLKRYAREYGKDVLGFDALAMEALTDYRWPGNVRELEHTVHRAVLASSNETIAAEDLALRVAPNHLSSFEDMTIAQMEAALIDRAMRRFSGNVSMVARALGLSRGALYRRLRRYQTPL